VMLWSFFPKGNRYDMFIFFPKMEKSKKIYT
jgi:hypothetical protein